MGFFRFHRGHKFASTALMSPTTEALVEQIERFLETEQLDVVAFERGKREDDIARRYLTALDYDEGVLPVGGHTSPRYVKRHTTHQCTHGLPKLRSRLALVCAWPQPGRSSHTP